ncbi:MAG: hypothetical protein JW765_08885 [Deltaproteobacteria bacterium]|nr:hypothetical protein [Candidatus Zymogenaceae bacterium]
MGSVLSLMSTLSLIAAQEDAGRSGINSFSSYHRQYLRSKTMKPAALLLLFCMISVLLGIPARADPLLSAETAAGLFSSRTNEEGRPFSPAAVTIVEGAFTAPGRTEAVVSFVDTSQSRAAGSAEIWLLRLVDAGWEPILKITDFDTAEFITTDLNGDGVREILTHTAGGDQGFLIIRRRLIYFGDGNPTDLLTFEGFDNTGWPDNGICAFDSCFTFRDVNRDGILEVELTQYYDYCKKEGDASVFLRRSPRTAVFRPVVSPSGSIIGIERLR